MYLIISYKYCSSFWLVEICRMMAGSLFLGTLHLHIENEPPLGSSGGGVWYHSLLAHSIIMINVSIQ